MASSSTTPPCTSYGPTYSAGPAPPFSSGGGGAVGGGSPLFPLSPPRRSHHRGRGPQRRELTEAERGEIAYAFDRLSAESQDGNSVTPRQLKVALRALGFPARKADVRGMLRDAGLDAAAPIDGPTFHELVAGALLARPRADEVARAFALFDVDGSGKVGPDALRAVARRLGLDVSPSELAAMVAEFDADGDGAVDAAEFAAIMAEAAGDECAAGGGDGVACGVGGRGGGGSGGGEAWWCKQVI